MMRRKEVKEGEKEERGLGGRMIEGGGEWE